MIAAASRCSRKVGRPRRSRGHFGRSHLRPGNSLPWAPPAGRSIRPRRLSPGRPSPLPPSIPGPVSVPILRCCTEHSAHPFRCPRRAPIRAVFGSPPACRPGGSQPPPRPHQSAASIHPNLGQFPGQKTGCPNVRLAHFHPQNRGSWSLTQKPMTYVVLCHRIACIGPLLIFAPKFGPKIGLFSLENRGCSKLRSDLPFHF